MAAGAAATLTFSGVVAALSGPLPAGAVVNNPPNNPTAPAISYEADCTSSLEAGQVAPFVTTLTGNTTVDSGAPTGTKFGFTGDSGVTIVGGFVAAIYARGLGTPNLGLKWNISLGSPDSTATGSYAYASPTVSEPDGGVRVPQVTWTSGSTTLTAPAGFWQGAQVGDAVSDNPGSGIPATATLTAVPADESTGTTVTISQPTTTTQAAPGVFVGLGKTTVFSAPITTGNVFTTAGVLNGKASVGMTSATRYLVTAGIQVGFGGAPGNGPSNCLLTGYDGATPTPNPGPGQTGGVNPPLDTIPVLPAGSVTPLVSVSPDLVFPSAAYVNLNGAAPGAPTGVTASANLHHGIVSFTPPANDGGSPITGYTVTAIDLTTPCGGACPTGTGTASPIHVPDTGQLTTGDTYQFTVVASNSVSSGPPSARSNPVTTGAPAAPEPPTIGTATPGDASAHVAFSPPASTGTAPVSVYTVTATDVTNPAHGGQTATGAASPVTVPGLTNGDTYTFTVTATNSVGVGAPSAASNQVTPKAPTAPGAPTGASAHAGDAAATVSWTAPASDGGSPITGYRVTSSPDGRTCTTGGATSCTVTGLSNGITYTFAVVAINAVGAGPSATTGPVTPNSPAATQGGYWIVTTDGGVFSHGPASPHGSASSILLTHPIVGAATVPDGKGYWLVASDGGIFAYGSAHFYGSMGGKPLNEPIVGMASTPDGKGYWEVASDGGIFSFGDAAFEGSTGGMHLNQPIVGMATAPGGGGYWLVASDGGIFAFGTAQFHGSLGAIHLNAPIVGATAAPDGQGYWMVASDGGVFAFGTAGFKGSAAGSIGGFTAVGIAASAGGYVVLASNGGVFTYGTPFYGSQAGTPLNAPVVAITG